MNYRDHFGVSASLKCGGTTYTYFSLAKAEAGGLARLSTLPLSLKILMESMLRNCNEKDVRSDDVHHLAKWQPKASNRAELPFKPARVVLQDFSGVPCLVDLAAMRSAMHRIGGNPKLIEPLIPAELVIDHSVQVDFSGTHDSLAKNMDLETKRNMERYAFMKWGQKAFEKFKVVPPGVGIIHQVNLEYLARGVFTEKHGGALVAFPDTLVGTDSHTTMVNGLGVVGFGVGGIEAEAVMLGQPIYMVTPDVIGVKLLGEPAEGLTATDIALTVTNVLRKKGVVGKFVEFYGPGVASLPLPDRATIANMCPEYGATIALFPIDGETLAYYRQTARSEQQVGLIEAYAKEQGMFWTPTSPDPEYTDTVSIDLSALQPCLAGPKRPQDRIPLSDLKPSFDKALNATFEQGGYNLTGGELRESSAIREWGNVELSHGSVVIAAITSCTNTSNPSVLIGAGLLAKKAVEKGLKVPPFVKTSLAPGSRSVARYLADTGLMPYLEQLGFHIVGYGCTTCIGNSGPLPDPVTKALGNAPALIVSSVLSGNRNFEGRIHPMVKANYLASPPLVVAFALAGNVQIDLTREPIGQDKEGYSVYLRDIWPTQDEIKACLSKAQDPAMFKAVYADLDSYNATWRNIDVPASDLYKWDANSTYIQDPPFFEGFSMETTPMAPIAKARALAYLGDSITTDHISPAGSIQEKSPAGQYLLANGVSKADFNSFGARRGNDRVMVRGTFANVRLKNRLVPEVEGPYTSYLPENKQMFIYDAAMKYKEAGTALVILAGKEWGTGSSRDWAAKGMNLLGIKAVLAESYERIHRSNLVGMGILPLQFKAGQTAQSCGLTGRETFTIALDDEHKPGQDVLVTAIDEEGTEKHLVLQSRVDTPIEVSYLKHGGILPYVLREMIAAGR